MKKLEWIDALKAFALIGIILNHFVEEFFRGPWFTNPSTNWPDFSTRMHQLLPAGDSIGSNILIYLGWLGDSGPGVFIVLSGLTLMLSFYKSGDANLNVLEFYKKRFLRIFPLYIAISVITIFISSFIPGNLIKIYDKFTLLSLIGLRFTDGLFYYINPSWWFIWLIIQLYIVFPILFYGLKKLGLKTFVIAVISFTVLSRAVGILNIQPINSMYVWMTGSFFGTRLAEFAMGMVSAYLIHNSKEYINNFFSPIRILTFSLSIYTIGILFSFTLIGSILSNLFVSIGLCGLFYYLWINIKALRFKFLNKIILWVGIYSYAIFLFHQYPLQLTSHFFTGVNHTIFAVLAILASFPIAFLLDKGTLFVVDLVIKYKMEKLNYTFIALCFFYYFSLYFIEPRLYRELKYNLFSIFNFGFIMLLGVVFIKMKPKVIELSFLLTTLIISITYFVFMHYNLGRLSLSLFILIFLISFGSFSILKNKIKGSILALLTILIIYGVTELYLRSSKPLETFAHWGEYPALQIHPTRVYSLKPNAETRLRYNNYDYILRTNRFGLASPSIDTLKPANNTLRILLVGDAFTMPEGMEYEFSYPALLQNTLQKAYPDKNIQVINGGVTGYGPIESYAEMKELTELFKPDLIIYEFFINEFDEVNISPESRIDGIGLKRKRPNRMLSYSQNLAYLSHVQENLMELLSGMSKSPNYYKSFLHYYNNNDSSLYSSSTILKIEDYLNLMKEVAHVNKSKFCIVYVPSSVCVSKKTDINYFPENINLENNGEYDLQKPLKYLSKITSKLNIDLLDLSPTLKKHPKQPVYFPDSWHWNKEGHKVVSNELIKYIDIKKYISE